MKTVKPNSSPPRTFLRLLAAWAVGGALYFGTLVVSDYDGFNTFVSGILGGAIISMVCVVFCAVVGLVLRGPWMSQAWHGSRVPAACVAVLGVVLFAFCFLPSQVRLVVSPDDGGAYREVGPTWVPGYLLLLFVVSHFPRVARGDRAR